MKALVSQTNTNDVKTEMIDVPMPAIDANEILIESHYSSINYKDALGITGRGRIFKQERIIGGIDVSGVVCASKTEQFHIGDHILITGCGLGETHDGGYAEFVKEKSENCIKIPKGLNLREVMIYGTAGFTAALALERMCQNGQKPEMGPILVTGASGGVGQFAISFFSQSGFEVHALTGKPELEEKLKSLGAKKIVLETNLRTTSRPLETVAYGGVVDNVGGSILANLLPRIELWGNVASIGMAFGAELQTNVMPFILRGVSVLGISSNNTPLPLRNRIWERLATDLRPENLEVFVSSEVTLDGVFSAAEKILSRKTQGRTIVRIDK